MKKIILYASLAILLGSGLFLFNISKPTFTVPMKKIKETIVYGEYNNPSFTVPIGIYIPKDFNKTEKDGPDKVYINYRLPFIEPVRLTNFDKDQLDSLSGLSSLTIYILPIREHEESMDYMNTLSGGLYRSKHIEINKYKDVFYTETIPFLEKDKTVISSPSLQCYYAFPLESEYYLVFFFNSTNETIEDSIKIQQQIISTLDLL